MIVTQTTYGRKVGCGMKRLWNNIWYYPKISLYGRRKSHKASATNIGVTVEIKNDRVQNKTQNLYNLTPYFSFICVEIRHVAVLTHQICQTSMNCQRRHSICDFKWLHKILTMSPRFQVFFIAKLITLSSVTPCLSRSNRKKMSTWPDPRIIAIVNFQYYETQLWKLRPKKPSPCSISAQIQLWKLLSS
jgi:hypothetical protein